MKLFHSSAVFSSVSKLQKKFVYNLDSENNEIPISSQYSSVEDFMKDLDEISWPNSRARLKKDETLEILERAEKIKTSESQVVDTILHTSADGKIYYMVTFQRDPSSLENISEDSKERAFKEYIKNSESILSIQIYNNGSPNNNDIKNLDRWLDGDNIMGKDENGEDFIIISKDKLDEFFGPKIGMNNESEKITTNTTNAVESITKNRV